MRVEVEVRRNSKGALRAHLRVRVRVGVGVCADEGGLGQERSSRSSQFRFKNCLWFCFPLAPSFLLHAYTASSI